MIHLRSNRHIWISELNAPYFTFPLLFICLQAKNKEKCIWCRGETHAGFYFSYLLHPAIIQMQLIHYMLRNVFTTAAHALFFSRGIQSETMFSLWMANFSITVPPVSMMMVVSSAFFLFQLSHSVTLWFIVSFRGWKCSSFRVNLRDTEQNRRHWSLFNASSQLHCF